MSARQARRRRREAGPMPSAEMVARTVAGRLLVVTDAATRAPTTIPAWHPEPRAGMELSRVGDVHGVAILCSHVVYLHGPSGPAAAIVAWSGGHPACPVTLVRYYDSEPARLAREMPRTTVSSGIPSADQMTLALAMFETAVSAYLADNPPAACGCDPGIELVLDLLSTSTTLNLVHEDGCSHVGRRPNGPRAHFMSPAAAMA